MKQVLDFMQFQRSVHEKDWLLYLASLERQCVYYHAYNRLDYAQNVPEYIARMYALQETDPAMWQYFMDGHFAIQKNEVPFTSIGVDHAQEHTNRELKGDNALKGMANNAESILNYCLAAPEIQKISSEFEEMIGLTVWSRKEHHQLSKATL